MLTVVSSDTGPHGMGPSPRRSKPAWPSPPLRAIPKAFGVKRPSLRPMLSVLGAERADAGT